jgi:hypothetical protein
MNPQITPMTQISKIEQKETKIAKRGILLGGLGELSRS